MEIRQLEKSEWTLYRDIRLEALRNDPDAFASDYDKESHRTKEEWQHRLAESTEPYHLKLFAIEEGRAVGMMGIYQYRDGKSPETLTLVGVYVTPHLRGRGVGKLLLDKIIESGRMVNGIKRLQLIVAKSQAVALGLYTKAGFETVDETKGGESYIMSLKL